MHSSENSARDRPVAIPSSRRSQAGASRPPVVREFGCGVCDQMFANRPSFMRHCARHAKKTKSMNVIDLNIGSAAVGDV